MNLVQYQEWCDSVLNKCQDLSGVFIDIYVLLLFKVLTPEEKKFILLVERGDCATVIKIMKNYKYKPQLFDINCLDPLGRSALSIAIINENPEMMEALLEEGIQVIKEALLGE